MKQIEFFQNALANSVETLINAEAQVMSHLDWLARQKRKAIIQMTSGEVFNTYDIFNHNKLSTDEMKIVDVEVHLDNNDIVNRLRNDNYYPDFLFFITVTFLCDPSKILNSKAKLTDKEESILKSMRRCYQLLDLAPEKDLFGLNRQLIELKHGYDMVESASYYYRFNEIFDKDFIKRGLMVNGIKITKNSNNCDLDE